MNAKSKKTIIGLTGNIATGKTVVRKMLGHLGAYTIDADALAHRIMATDGPGYKPILDQFGKFILKTDGTIDRSKLGKLVFADPDALEQLEAIVHPYVRKAVDYLIKNAKQDVVVVEAIKLLESPIRDKVDTIWVTVSTEYNQLARLATKRNMSKEDAQARMTSQTEQALKVAQADYVIENDGTFEETWEQVQDGWDKLFPDMPEEAPIPEPAAEPLPGETLAAFTEKDMVTDRAKPRQAEDIANLITKLSGGQKRLERMDVMALFGEKAFMLLYVDGQLVGVVGWQVENLVARVDEVWLEEELNHSAALKVLMESIERASKELQAEALLVFVDPEQAADTNLWQPLDYRIHTVDQLEIDAWKQAALESQPPDTLIFFKQLRVDRVLRPI